MYVIMTLHGIHLRRLSRKARVSETLASAAASESLGSIRTIRAFVAEPREMERYESALAISSKNQTHLGLHIGMFQGLMNASVGSLILLILYSGGERVARGEMNGGQLMAFMVATQNAQKSLVSLGSLFSQVLKSLGSFSRVIEYIHQKPLIPLRGGVKHRFKGYLLLIQGQLSSKMSVLSMQQGQRLF